MVVSGIQFSDVCASCVPINASVISSSRWLSLGEYCVLPTEIFSLVCTFDLAESPSTSSPLIKFGRGIPIVKCI